MPQISTHCGRKTFICYPNKATRELLMNICLHRAYNGSNSPAHVYEYADRLEFDNTGNLYGKARPENFPTETDYRNPLISGVMKALNFVNRFGMGIGLVADELKANGNPPAEYIFSEPSSFKVIVKSADPYVNQSSYKSSYEHSQENSQEGSQKTADKILAIIRRNQYVTASEIAGELGISTRSVWKNISKMRGEVIEHIGPKKGGSWKILK